MWKNVSTYAPRGREKSEGRDSRPYSGFAELGLKPQSTVSQTKKEGQDKTAFYTGCVTVLPVLSPPESSYTSTSTSGSSESTSSSSITSPIEQYKLDPKPRGSFWAQYPARPPLPGSRGRVRTARYTPLPSPYASSDTDDDEEDDEADDALRAKSQKWFLAPPRLERASSGSTIVRQLTVAVDETATRRVKPKRTTGRPRFKLFHMEDDKEERTEHMDDNREVLERLFEGPGTRSSTSELTEHRRNKREATRHELRHAIDAADWPLRDEVVDIGHRQIDETSMGPLSKHVDRGTVCWRGKHTARYNAMVGYRDANVFQAFKDMSEPDRPSSSGHNNSDSGPVAFSVQLSLISDSSRPPTIRTSFEPCLTPPRRRSDGDLLRKRVLEWNMVLNGKVSNVRPRGDKAPRDQGRRSSCPAKLGSTMPDLEEEQEEEEEQAVGELEYLERVDFQNR